MPFMQNCFILRFHTFTSLFSGVDWAEHESTLMNQFICGSHSCLEASRSQFLIRHSRRVWQSIDVSPQLHPLFTEFHFLSWSTFLCVWHERGKSGEHSLSKSVRLVRCSNVDWISLSFSTRANLVRGKKKSKYDSVECPSGNLLYQKRKCYSGRFRISTENGIELASRRANLSSIQCACAFQPLSARVCGRDFHVDVL